MEKQYRYEKEVVLAALASGNLSVKEEGPEYAKQGRYTYEDYLKLQEEPGYRFEILEGFLVKEPSPSMQHQRLSRELGRRLMAFFDDYDPDGELFFAPLDVTLTISNVVQPDILFVSVHDAGKLCAQNVLKVLVIWWRKLCPQQIGAKTAYRRWRYIERQKSLIIGLWIPRRIHWKLLC